jgi:hypothetical protein
MRVPLFPSAHRKFPTNLDMGNDFEERKSNIFFIREVMDRETPF